jgi:hypothetical protein
MLCSKGSCLFEVFFNDDLALDDVALTLGVDIDADELDETYVTDGKPLTLTVKWQRDLFKSWTQPKDFILESRNPRTKKKFVFPLLIMYMCILMSQIWSFLFLFFSFFFFQDRDSYWKMMQKYIGSDVTSMVTLPVLIFEPMSMLQKMAEVCVNCFLTACLETLSLSDAVEETYKL